MEKENKEMVTSAVDVKNAYELIRKYDLMVVDVDGVKSIKPRTINDEIRKTFNSDKPDMVRLKLLIISILERTTLKCMIAGCDKDATKFIMEQDTVTDKEHVILAFCVEHYDFVPF